jgi:2'-5' RNA ligase
MGMAIRAFVAIELSDAIKQALDRLQRLLAAGASERMARWVSPRSIHLTLKFLGDIPERRVDEISAALRIACAGHAPFGVRLTDLGCFPNAKRLRVVWVGVGGDVAPLVSLQRSIDQELERLDFKREKRGFTPHLTLARIRDWVGPGERRELAARLSTLQVPPANMPVRSIAFIRSDLRPSGAVYSLLSTIPLGDSPAG